VISARLIFSRDSRSTKRKFTLTGPQFSFDDFSLQIFSQKNRQHGGFESATQSAGESERATGRSVGSVNRRGNEDRRKEYEVGGLTVIIH
jgi:hypothetical protein